MTTTRVVGLTGFFVLLLALPIIVVVQSNKENTASNAHADALTTTWPTTPPAQICGDTSQLSGPATAPAGSITVPAGDNSTINFGQPNTIYWFVPGIHTLGTNQFSQIAPGNNSTFIGAPGAIIDGQLKNLYAFVGHPTGVTIKYLTIQNFGPAGANNNEGVVNHDAGQNWTISYNTVQNNAGAGIFVGSNDTISYNCLTSNGQYGFSAYDPNGVSNVILDHNEISFNDTYDWESHIQGCGCTGGGKFWATTNATITNNYVHDNHSVGIWADTNNTGFDFENNYISNNYAEGILYEISYNALIKNNMFLNNAWGAGPTNPGFPTGAIYLSESGSDARVAGNYGASLDISGNMFQDNWGGVILWENADRFCSSSANTSSGTCTLVNPTVANLATCGNATDMAQAPYINDCRWKTQNVQVHDNMFQLNTGTVANCTAANACGYNGIFSQYGSFAPFKATVVEDHITLNQNNKFFNNTYVGPWNFMIHEQGNTVPLSAWQAAPYNQDAGSKFNGTVIPGTGSTLPATTMPSQPTATTSPPQPTTASNPTVTSTPTNPTKVPPPATPAPVSNGNSLDANTATLESTNGQWGNWYSATIANTTTQVHTGTHSLQVKVTANNGWGVQLLNWPGFTTTPGQKTISFWGLKGTNTTAVTMGVTWMSADNKPLQTNQLAIPSLTTAWQKASSVVAAPAGTTHVYLNFVGNSSKGTIFYLDDIFVTN